MTESAPEPDLDLTSDEITPLRWVASAAHELFVELEYAGFQERARAQIIAHFLFDALDGFDPDPDLFEDDDEDEDYDPEEDDDEFFA